MHTVGHRATVHAKAHGKVAILYSGQLSGPEQAELRPRPAEADTARRVAAGADERQLLSLPSRMLLGQTRWAV